MADFNKFLENRPSALKDPIMSDQKYVKDKGRVTLLNIKHKIEQKCLYCSMIGRKIYNCKKFRNSCQ